MGTLHSCLFYPSKSYYRERLSMVDLLVLTSSDQLLFYIKYYIPFLQKATLMRRSTVLSPPPHPLVSIPWHYQSQV
jgi:hypothetical protein